ncbi:endonuclease domain-containing protein [candidate division TA06 bacterium]|nr:endonuclease domain-containing protein [candidate division TA06 bacterium]
MSLNIKSKLVLVAKARCRELRKNQTKAEVIFWNKVRNRQFLGLKFYRQYPLFFDLLGKETFYIADFYCHEKRLVVELDGGIHDKQRRQDKLRDDVIDCLGIKVLRISNNDIFNNMDKVLKQVTAVLT